MEKYLHKYADFLGRANRTEFWLYTLFIFILSTIIIGLSTDIGSFSLSFVFFIVTIIPTIAITIRRLRDAGVSVWLIFISIIPLGVFALIILLMLGSKDKQDETVPEIKKPNQRKNKIINYLEENKNDYSQRDLIFELKKSGYNDLEIQDGIEIVFNSNLLKQKNKKDEELWFLDDNDKNKNIAEEKKIDTSKNITINHIILKWFPIIGMFFIVGGLSYLFYDGLWKNVNEIGRLFIGFIFGIIFILGGYSFKDKLHGFGDTIIGGGVLIMYVTLIYGSRFQPEESVIIPEILALIIALIFSGSIAFYTYIRQSKHILILGVLGGYLTPFFVGRSGEFENFLATSTSFQYELNLYAFLIYFLAVGITLFIVSNKMFLKGVGLLNSIGLFIGTFLLVIFIGDEFIANVSMLAIFSVAVVIMHIAAMVINAKKFESETDPYLIAGYILPLIWFVIMSNSFLDEYLSNIINTVLFIGIAITYFSGWYYLRNTTNSNNHFTLYIGGQVSVIIGMTYIFPSLNEYQGLFLSAVSLVFIALYYKKALISREVSMLLFSLGGVLFNLSVLNDISFKGIGPLSGESIFTIMTLLPFVIMAPMTKIIKQDSDLLIIRKIAGYLASILIFIILLLDIFSWENVPLDFLFLTIPALVLVIIGVTQKQNNIQLKFLNTAVIIGTIGIIGRLIPISSDIITTSNKYHFLATKESLIGITTLIILFLAVYGYKKLVKNEIIKKIPLVVNIDLYIVLLLVITHEIIGALNSFELDFSNQAIQGIRAFSVTLWWAGLSLWLLFSAGLSNKLKDKKSIGFVFLVITILKLIFYDLSNINTNLKVFLFIIVGIAITAVSYHANKKQEEKT